MNKQRLAAAAAAITVWGCLTGLTLIRLWAVLYGALSGPALMALAALLAAAALALAIKLRLFRCWLLPFGRSWKTALLAVAAFALGAAFDISYDLFYVGEYTVGALPFRLASAAGSGIVLAAVVLTAATALREFGRIECRCGHTLLALALAVNVIAAWYCAGSARVYYWDNATYWDISSMLAAQPLDIEQLRLVLRSTVTEEYNYLLAWPVSLVMRLLGTNRYVFILSTVNFYVLPALWGLLVLGRRSRRGGLLLCCAAPMLLYTALVGFVDVAAAGAGIWAFIIYTDRSRPQGARGVLTAMLLVLMFLLRRYFFFFTVSFGFAAFASLLADRKQWKSFAALVATGLACSLYFGQSFVVEQVLSANYFDTYSAYDQGRWVDAVMFCRYFGWILPAVAAAALVWLLARRREWRYGALLSLLQPALCFLLFTSVQSHGQQHLLLYLPALACALAGGLEALPERRCVRALPWALALCALVSSFIPREQPSSSLEVKTLSPLPSFTYAPPQRQDIAQLVALRAYVDGLSADGEKTAAVIASSFTFNSAILENTYRSLGIPQPDAPQTEIVYFATVDKRDAFSWDALEADHLIVADPIQTHLGADNQHLVDVLAQPVLSGEGLGTAYERLDTSFALEDGVTVYIFRRTRPITAAERQYISDTLTGYYPEYAELYDLPED